MIPRQFVGGWIRRSLRLGDGDAHESSCVVWLQAEEHFADLRVPLGDAVPDDVDPSHPVMCFAGTTSWNESSQRLHWRHAFDLDAWGADDGGRVWFESGDLIEAGTFDIDGEEVPYVEVWAPLQGAHGSWTVLLSECGQMVRVGAHCITVSDRREHGGDFSAAHRIVRNGVWTTLSSYGASCDSLPSAPDTVGCGELVELGGRAWTVVEHRGEQ